MEPEAAWMPWEDSQLTNWIMDPFDLSQMENYGSMEPEAASMPQEEYQYAATEVESPAATQNEMIEKATVQKFEEVAQEFKVDIDMMQMKIHRYPPSLGAFDEWFTTPRMVAMGPYHHIRVRNQQKLEEKVKHVAAHHCIRESGCSIQELYGAVVSAAQDARHLYDKDTMTGIGDDDFLTMMFYDACFLVQYMLWCTHDASEMDPSLRSFFYFNRKVLRHDLMLLENQLPWRVVETVMKFRPVNLVDFITYWRDYLQDRTVLEEKPVVWDDNYEIPHLLGLLRFYMVGKSKSKVHARAKLTSLSVSASATELAEIGIKLTAAKDTTELIHMDVKRKGILSAELSLAPLSHDEERASFLINMVALELCTTSHFLAYSAKDEDSAVCSYLHLLSMLVHKEEDVQELRTKQVLQGRAGLINKDALDFFTSLQSLPLHGSCYVRVMVEIENYKVSRKMWTKVHAFFYHTSKKTILTVLTVVGLLVSILGTLMSLKASSKN
ncbi:unnamed protein product [Urochloa decumbens]|uniref:Uncharacterized protein n=1 Tax=Urochloa decumbens TaxID=240449 RepID=A0ABC9AMS2_9POAL